MSSFAVIILCAWCFRLWLQTLEHKALRKPLLQRKGALNPKEGLLYSYPACQSNTRLPDFSPVTFAALKRVKQWLSAYIWLPFFCLIKLVSRWKNYPLPLKVSGIHQTCLLEPGGVVSTKPAKCLRLFSFCFIAAFLLSTLQTVAGSFCISFLLPLSLVLFKVFYMIFLKCRIFYLGCFFLIHVFLLWIYVMLLF